jgi:hypothetical protein
MTDASSLREARTQAMLGRDALMAEKTSVRGFFEFLAAGEMGGLVAACGDAPAGACLTAHAIRR